MPTPSDAAQAAAGGPAVIRKYANRRLYDTSRARCVTLADIARRVRAGESVRIVNARGGADVTRHVLAQILCESESSATAALFDEAVLARLIALSGSDNAGQVSGAVARALDQIGAGRGQAHGTGRLRPRGGGPSARAVTARLDALEARLKGLIAAADASAARRRSPGEDS
ncbi:MAG: hypothetical protein RL477_1333 [Pseudomonadota bacterium]